MLYQNKYFWISLVSVALVAAAAGALITWAIMRTSNIKSNGPDVPGQWKDLRDWNFSTTDHEAFLKDFIFDNVDWNGGNAVYVSDNSRQLVKVENKQLVISPGDVLDGGCIGTGKCMESVKLVSKFALVPNRIIAFKASDIPGDWDNPGITPSWPAFWLAPAEGKWGENAGEIDIYESVNGANVGVITTQHTTPNCSMDGSVPGKSILREKNCNSGKSPTLPSTGCGIVHTNTLSARSGTFACVWELSGATNSEGVLNFFWWPYDSELPDKTGGVWSKYPDPAGWESGKYGSFKISPLSCSSDHFSSFNLIINTNFCGEWSGDVFSGGQEACGNAIVNADKSKLAWRFDRIRLLSKGEDIDVPLWNGIVEKCTPEGGDIYSTGVIVECCKDLIAFKQPVKDSANWPILCYRNIDDCTRNSTQTNLQCEEYRPDA